MEESASGIILRVRPLTETSLIIHWLTPGIGRVATVAKGARRPKSPFAGKLDLFYEAQFSFYRSRRSELHTLREVVLTDAHGGLRRHIEAVAQAAYFAVLIEAGTETETPVPDLFHLLGRFVGMLEKDPKNPLLFFAFEWQVLKLLGFEPKLETIRLSSAGRAVLQSVTGQTRIEEIGQEPGLKEVNQLLQRAIGRSFERVPPQRLEAARLLGLL
jgi:DNA repair protein RecO (recombination protein O)